MNVPCKHQFSLTAAVGFVAVLLVACGRESPVESISWSASIPLGIERINGEQRLFVYFQAGWCRVCKRMDRDTFRDGTVTAMLETMIPVKIDVDAQPRTARHYGVDAVPAYVVLDKRGRVRARSLGYLSAPELAGFIRLATETRGSDGADDRLPKNPAATSNLEPSQSTGFAGG